MGGIVAAILPQILGVISKVVPDKAQADELRAQITTELLANDASVTEAAAGVIKAEAQSKFALTAMWRPILMLVFTAILGREYLLAPFLAELHGKLYVSQPLPAPFWSLLQIGVGGYIGGRSLEKIAGSVSSAIGGLKG